MQNHVIKCVNIFTSKKPKQNSLELFTGPCLCATIPHVVCFFIEEENVKLDMLLSNKCQLKTVLNLQAECNTPLKRQLILITQNSVQCQN